MKPTESVAALTIHTVKPDLVEQAKQIWINGLVAECCALVSYFGSGLMVPQNLLWVFPTIACCFGVVWFLFHLVDTWPWREND